MRRDDPALGASLHANPTAAVLREATWFGPQGGLFGWRHDSPEALSRDLVAVLCPPFGPEYTRTHRTLRHLADRLARHGVPAFRFDYYGTGDSVGSEADSGLFERWRASVVEAVREARRWSGRTRVCLVGVRLGASLAALAAEEAGIDALVLWNPVAKGRAYVRELKAMALTAKDPADAPGDGLESAGFTVRQATLDAISAIDLERVPIAPHVRVLRIGRDDLPGWDGMMLDHQFTVVPDAALDAIADAVAAHAPLAVAPAMNRAVAAVTSIKGVRERLCRMGPNDHLFGVLADPRHPGRPEGAMARGPITLVLLNAGSIHHVGPHRLYVRLARELARLGHSVLRMDLEGIGDSVLRGPGRENHPYSPTAMQDLQAAIAWLRRETGAARFAVVGICSGAYNTFQAGLAIEDPGVERLVMVNPWYFHWREGLSLDTTISSHYEDVAAYRRSMRDPERWKRLLRGEADLGRLARVAAAHVMKVARGRWDDLREMAIPSTGTRLSQDIRRIASRGRRMHVILSDGEPAAALLDTEAKRAVRRATRAGIFSLERIPGGDHTFSRSRPRDELVRKVRALLG